MGRAYLHVGRRDRRATAMFTSPSDWPTGRSSSLFGEATRAPAASWEIGSIELWGTQACGDEFGPASSRHPPRVWYRPVTVTAMESLLRTGTFAAQSTPDCERGLGLPGTNPSRSQVNPGSVRQRRTGHAEALWGAGGCASRAWPRKALIWPSWPFWLRPMAGRALCPGLWCAIPGCSDARWALTSGICSSKMMLSY